MKPLKGACSQQPGSTWKLRGPTAEAAGEGLLEEANHVLKVGRRPGQQRGGREDIQNWTWRLQEHREG